ncbi:MAG: hypothetical protein KC613_22270, partial [Myxococcales bacterium]|nr:hypothetical protein [Myxococcales bacterium]
MARDALRRVDAPVRPARTVLWTLTWALALCLPLAACDGGDPADPAVSAPPGASPRDLQPVAAPLAPAPVVLASAADVAAFNARGAARLLGGLRLTGRLPAQV